MAVNALVERILARAGLIAPGNPWYPRRPVMITQNDYHLRLFNGDVGVILPDPRGQGGVRAVFPGEGGILRRIHPLRLPPHETVFAMSVHKSQGSEFERVLFILPDRDSPVLSRELVYTAVTRARRQLDIMGNESVFRAALSRRIERTSGLKEVLKDL
ncbi:MAG: ATP-binding domain-containing protein [Deltaproteobacteria bacterium]|nr:ATP-binding domain-containing protein [Deltaproteobacteria bacterium]